VNLILTAWGEKIAPQTVIAPQIAPQTKYLIYIGFFYFGVKGFNKI
jgi:hypothetical protein